MSTPFFFDSSDKKIENKMLNLNEDYNKTSFEKSVIFCEKVSKKYSFFNSFILIGINPVIWFLKFL